MALEQEPLADAIERADSTLRFTATNGEENGPYRWDRFVLVRGESRIVALGMDVLEKVLTVRFPEPILEGDQVEVLE